MDKSQLDMLKKFVLMCESDPSILHMPELTFFSRYLQSLGATIPQPKPKATEPPRGEFKPAPKASETEEADVEDEEIVESDLELDNTDVTTDDDEDMPEYADANVEVTDDMIDQASDKRNQAMDAMADGRLEDGVQMFTDAIKLNPTSALLYAKRASRNPRVKETIAEKSRRRRERLKADPGRWQEIPQGERERAESNRQRPETEEQKEQIRQGQQERQPRIIAYLRMKKAKKCIHDCTKAIELNPDSAQGYKWRGKAHKLLGNWEDAYHDLTLACKLDYDDDANTALHDVTPNAKKIMEHKRKYERQREEMELKHRKERIRKAREEYEQRKEEQTQEGGPGEGYPGFPGAFPGSMGGMPGMPDMTTLLQDPELLTALQDPEVSAAFQDVASNPANMSKYQGNPRVQRVINKLAAKFGTGAQGAGEGPGPDTPADLPGFS